MAFHRSRPIAVRPTGGVCKRLAEHFALDPAEMHRVWVILSIFPGNIYSILP